ncbi:hypothetical protein [Limnofasciculus baicalensis]|uniref:Uncharacterized protein n=1 Tax=Limnofasciculus baicalensis BBK-W-15 TaxID=2699891 RepID=A0AAE3KP80_9CYAN|nr:hypothetical protein [Limnofasciculus baicalensis]MCP2730621.1 hypothetical protein [Limnofasciculus baicalensis BBK-W-15]
MRYTRNKFPEDLIFQETANTEQFQGRYILRHPFTGEMACKEAQYYRKYLQERFKKEAETLANLTGWKIEDIRKKRNLSPSESNP